MPTALEAQSHNHVPSGSDGKESTCNVGGLGLIFGLGRTPGEGNGNPLQYSCLKNPYVQRNLADYSPWSYKEFDMTERLSTAQLGKCQRECLDTKNCKNLQGQAEGSS